MASEKFDVCVVGAGPGGYVAAIRAAQLGFKTAIVEREALGGVCLNVGCIPSKAMISAAHFLHKLENSAQDMGFELKGPVKVNMQKLESWKQGVCDRMSSGVAQLLKGNQVEVFMGEAEFESQQKLMIRSKDSVMRAVEAKHFIIANGSRPIEVPGFKIDEKEVLSSTGALALKEVPKRLLVIGGGYIGLEISSYMRKLGAEVIVAEAQESLLAGVADPDCVQVVARKLQKSGVKIMLQTKATAYKKTSKGLEVALEVGGTQGTRKETVVVDYILLTVGRRPNSDQMNLKKVGIAIDSRGFIEVNAQRRTSLPHIFAIGDVAGQPMLAHKASHEGVLVAEVISGANRAFDAKTVPAVIFVDPEIASVGWTEAECQAHGYKGLKVGKFPFAANGRAVSMMETDGFVKVIADEATHVILGVHIVGPEASNLISEAALAIEMGARLEDLALTIHPHPTLGETVMEAAEAALGHAIHVIQRPLAKNKSNGAGHRTI